MSSVAYHPEVKLCVCNGDQSFLPSRHPGITQAAQSGEQKTVAFAVAFSWHRLHIRESTPSL